MKYFIIAATALALVQTGLCGPGRAEVALTLENCRERAVMHSENLQVEKARREQAYLRTREQRTHYFPKVTASGHYISTRNRLEWEVDRALFDPLGRIIDTGAINPVTGRPIDDISGHYVAKQSAYISGVRAEQPLYMGGKIRTANRMAGVAEEISLKAVDAERQEVLAEADHTYWRFVAVHEKIQAAEAYVDLLNALEERVDHAVETGLVHRNELLKVRVRRNEALLDLERAKNGSELLRMSLCRLMGYDLDQELHIADEEIIVPSGADMPEGPRLSVGARPEYRMLEDKVRLQQEKERLVRSDFLPQVGLAAGYSYVGGVEVFHTDLSSRGYYLMASAEVPLWQWGEGRYRTESARLDSRIAELDLEKYEKLMELEIQQAYFAMSEAHSRCRMTEAALEEAQAAMETSRDLYDVGLETLTDHLESQARLHQARAEHIAARADFKIQETNYHKATGTLAAAGTPGRPGPQKRQATGESALP